MSEAVRTLGGFPIVETDTDALIATLRARRDDGSPTELMFANTNFIVTCHAFASRLSGPETIIVNDGIGVDLASLLIAGRRFPENLAGTDFIPRLLAALDRPTRLFLLGARPDVVRAAATLWARLPNVEIAGIADGYADMSDDDALTARIAKSRADILFVALGDPRQAQWIAAHRERHGVPCVIAVGAIFDFVVGRVTRAPRLMRTLHMEWLFRLAHEPRRLLKRYSVDLVLFFAHCIATHRMARRAADDPLKRLV